MHLSPDFSSYISSKRYSHLIITIIHMEIIITKIHMSIMIMSHLYRLSPYLSIHFSTDSASGQDLVCQKIFDISYSYEYEFIRFQYPSDSQHLCGKVILEKEYKSSFFHSLLSQHRYDFLFLTCFSQRVLFSLLGLRQHLLVDHSSM